MARRGPGDAEAGMRETDPLIHHQGEENKATGVKKITDATKSVWNKLRSGLIWSSEIVFGPWIVMLAAGLVVEFVYFTLPAIVSMVELVVALVFFVFAFLAYTSNKKFRCYMMLLWGAAVLLGLVAGLEAYHVYLVQYWSFTKHRMYTNVSPDEPAAAHDDASLIVFEEGARPDITRPTGFTRLSTYCVAPILMRESSAPASEEIQYWAVGKDCCQGLSEYKCDDVLDPSARGAVVVGRQDDAGPLGFMAGFQDETIFYMQAIQMASVAYGLNSAKKPMLVRWVKNVNLFRAWWFTKALWNLIYLSLVWLMFCFFAGISMFLWGGLGSKDSIAAVKKGATNLFGAAGMMRSNIRFGKGPKRAQPL
eukprot:gnl/TRDRNA2_/TRDRNA2_189086_c0_seq1.p1 gnl/TRDRNA2_/TRDRNA2_189086_c0~~gnl/TRDRNA2_/TRDRNA2_189086_c0_seq1.p1  ORF type:complete len:365 (-),score=60.41 gnl/TRDRNA2_/TRDRNA2_189086_c0_seq1:135-1229(-)